MTFCHAISCAIEMWKQYESPSFLHSVLLFLHLRSPRQLIVCCCFLFQIVNVRFIEDWLVAAALRIEMQYVVRPITQREEEEEIENRWRPMVYALPLSNRCSLWSNPKSCDWICLKFQIDFCEKRAVAETFVVLRSDHSQFAGGNLRMWQCTWAAWKSAKWKPLVCRTETPVYVRLTPIHCLWNKNHGFASCKWSCLHALETYGVSQFPQSMHEHD